MVLPTFRQRKKQFELLEVDRPLLYGLETRLPLATIATVPNTVHERVNLWLVKTSHYKGRSKQ